MPLLHFLCLVVVEVGTQQDGDSSVVAAGAPTSFAENAMTAGRRATETVVEDEDAASSSTGGRAALLSSKALSLDLKFCDRPYVGSGSTRIDLCHSFYPVFFLSGGSNAEGGRIDTIRY